MPRRSLIPLLAVVALAIAGCGGDDETTTGASTPDATTTTAPETPQVYIGAKVEDARFVGSDEPVLRVAAVAPGSPAAEAGLKPSNLILEIDGEPVENTADLFAALGEHVAGDEVELTIEGKKGDETLTVTVTDRPQDPGKPPGG